MKYVGIDYHKDVLAVCIQNRNGKTEKEFMTAANENGIDEIVKVMGKHKFKVMGEASTYSINLHCDFLSKGVDSFLVDPKKIKTIVDSDQKTDKHDAKELATFLRLYDKGEISLSISHIVMDEQRDLRDLCRCREHLAEEKGKCIQKIKCHMRIHNESLENGYDDFTTEKGQTMLRTSFGNDLVLMTYLDEYLFFDNKAKSIDTIFAKDNYDSEEVELLVSIPGVGRLTSIQINSMIVDVNRFETSDKMRGYFGMANRVRDSSKSIKHGHITKCGDPMMRKILGRILNQFIIEGKDNFITRYYYSHVDSKGKKITRVACMNKILDLIYAILKRRSPYRQY